MRPAEVNWVGIAVLVLVTAGIVAWLVWSARSRGLFARPALLVCAIAASLPPLWAALVWSRLVEDRFVRLERPDLVWPAALAAVFVVHRLLDLPGRFGRTRRVLTELLLSLSAITAELAVVGIEAGMPLDRLTIILAVDRSRSIDLVPQADARLRAERSVAELSMRPGDRIASIAFARTAALEDGLRPRSRLPAPQQAELSRDATDIGAAIRRALAEVPQDSAARIVVLSDGVATRGDALAAAAAATAAGIPVDAVLLEQAALADVRVVSVRTPSKASEGEPIELRVATTSSADAEVEVRVLRDGELLRKGRTKVMRGDDLIRLREVASGPGLHRYDVQLTAVDPALDLAPEDNAGSSFVRVGGPASTLIMSGTPARAVALERALSAAGFRVNTVASSGVPADVTGLLAYDLVVLTDIPATDLAPTQLSALETYVKDLGGGLLLLGGERDMGPGGYGKTVVEELSPVSFDLKQDRRRASLAEVIAIDISGSMAVQVNGRTKLQLANEAAVRSADLLGEGDRIGVLHVDTAVKWTVALGPLSDKPALAQKIRAVGPGGGGIYVDITLQAAYAALSRERVNLKHLLLFADGDDAEERTHAFALVSDAQRRGITTSVVALGRGQDVAALEHLSRAGGGRFYLIEDAARLPAVFAQETILASRSSINEVKFQPALAATGGPVRGIDFGAAPELSGYVVTIPKARAQVLLRGPENDPILASWSIGLGRAAAFTSDYSDRWGSAWTDWPGAGQLFAQLARELARSADDPRARLEADTLGAELHARATVVDDDGRAESFRRLRLRVGGPDGHAAEVALEASGAGSYAAHVPLARPGAYAMTAIDELTGRVVATTGAVMTAGEELRPTGSDRALLAQLAEISGGTLRETLAGVFNDRSRMRFTYESWTAFLVQLCLASLLLGVVARRLAVPLFATRALARHRQRRLDRRSERRRQQELRVTAASHAVEALSPLQAAKERSRGIVPPARDLGGVAVPPAAAAPARSSAVAEQPTEGAAERAPATTAEILLARRRGRQR